MIWLKLTFEAQLRQSHGHFKYTILDERTIMFVIHMKWRTHFSFGCVGPWSMRMKAIMAYRFQSAFLLLRVEISMAAYHFCQSNVNNHDHLCRCLSIRSCNSRLSLRSHTRGPVVQRSDRSIVVANVFIVVTEPVEDAERQQNLRG